MPHVHETPSPAPPSLDRLRQHFLDAQLAGDRRKALDLVSTAMTDHQVPTRDLRLHVIRAAQEEIGRLWQENVISVAQEHMATAISQLALADVFQREQPPAPNGRKIIVACVDGELHDFPARIVADELDVAGFDVRFLGASVPVESLVSFIARENPDLLVLSATMGFHADSVRAAVQQVRRLAPGLPIAVGGQVCERVESLAAELAVELSGCDVAELVGEVRRLLQAG